MKIQAFTPRRLKLAVIVLPLLLTALYLYGPAADRYVSESEVSVRQANQGQSTLPGIAMLLGGANPASHDDMLYLQEYVHSLNMLRRLDEKLGVRKHYEAQSSDWLFRLWPGSNQERFLDYYRSRVEVVYDDASSLLNVSVQAFDREFAQRLNQAILDECERFVNEYSREMARGQMAFGESELARAAKRLQESKAQVLDFQTKNKLVDPMAQMQANSSLTAELQVVLARQEADLRNLRTYLSDDSYQVRAQRSQLESTRAQLDAERQRATAPGATERLNALAAQFQDLVLQETFAQDGYRVALATVENSRIEAIRKLKGLVVIEPPSLPESAQYPRRIYNLVTLLILSFLLYAVARLVVATIREHTD